MSKSSRKRPLSCRETSMIAAIALLFLIVTVLVVLVAVFAGSYHKSRSKYQKLGDAISGQKSRVCVTADCVEVAGKTIANMNMSVDPCKDFYQYVCGRFMKNTVLKQDEAVMDLGIYDISGDTEAKLIKALKSPSTIINGKRSTAVQKAKRFFAACLNVSSNTNNGPGILQEYIDSLGGWPLSGYFDSGLANVAVTAAKVARTGSSGLFGVEMGINDFNNSRFITSLTPTMPPLQSPSIYNSTDAMDKYRTLIEGVVKLLGGDVTLRASIINDIIDIDKAVAKIIPPPAIHTNVTLRSNMMTVQEVQNLIGPKFMMANFLEYILGYSILPTKKVLVAFPSFLSGVKAILDKYSKESSIAYLVWTSVYPRINYLSEPFTELFAEAKQKVNFDPNLCLQLSKKYFTQVIGAIYVEHYYDKSATAKIDEMLVRARQAFRDNLPSVEWMDEVSKQKAFEKLRALKHKVSYNDINVDAAALDRAYQFYGPIIEDNFFATINNIEQGAFKRMLSQRGKPVTLISAIFGDGAPDAANAAYMASKNAIITWAGILDYAYYDEDFPIGMLYGSIGFVLGHEITHGYDTIGKDYDKVGNYKPWLSEASLAEFNKRAQCLVKQYGQYEILPGAKVDGELTLAENIADNGGIKVAYDAYQSWRKARGDKPGLEPKLPGLDLTHEQLFFVAMATPWCTTATDAAYRQLLTADEHSPGKFRIIGPLSNYAKFSEAFNCPIGSYMNPRDKCIIW